MRTRTHLNSWKASFGNYIELIIITQLKLKIRQPIKVDNILVRPLFEQHFRIHFPHFLHQVMDKLLPKYKQTKWRLLLLFRIILFQKMNECIRGIVSSAIKKNAYTSIALFFLIKSSKNIQWRFHILHAATNQTWTCDVIH